MNNPAEEVEGLRRLTSKEEPEPSLAAILAAAAALAACGNDERQAEAETPVSEAEVSTELPESVVSDEALNATAEAAADVAASPPPVVAVPVPPPANATSPQGRAASSEPARPVPLATETPRA